uniref:Uncharacterized protein n=1 Tax=Amphimedon queenslandica TaxID=400682 RepID=A0A1X7TPN4_AMPQE
MDKSDEETDSKTANSMQDIKKLRSGPRSIESKQCPPCEELLKYAKDVFGSLTQISVDNRGLMYHSSQYGVILIIPKGAVQESATVWFGACLFSDKFEFGDYVPVTPIVWVYIDRNKADQNKFALLKADNGDYTFHQQTETDSELKMDRGFKLIKINSLSFCTTCAAIHKNYYESFAKQYLIAITEKYEAKEVTIDFIFLSRQQGWKKIIAAQCEKEGFEIITYKPVTFTSDDPVSLTFEPDNIPGWTRQCDIPNITASSIHQKLRKIDPQKDEFSFHNLPHFKIQFTHNETLSEHPQSKEVTIRFNQVNPPFVSTVLLKSHLLLLTATSDTELHSTVNDPLLGDCLQIIAMEGNLQKKWFDLGYRLEDPPEAQAVDVTKLRKAVENAINSQYRSLNRLPAASVKDFAYSLFSKKVISESVCSDPTIDKILGEFKASLGFTRTIQEFESSCTKLLQSMSSVGGSYHAAGAALKDDLIDAVQKDCKYSFNISM